MWSSIDYTVSFIPRGADWPVNFPLQSAMEYVSAMGLHLETIFSRLFKKQGGRLAYSEESYRTIGASEGHIDIIRKDYKPTWDKCAHQQRDTLLKPPMFLTQNSLGFLRKEPFVRSCKV